MSLSGIWLNMYKVIIISITNVIAFSFVVVCIVSSTQFWKTCLILFISVYINNSSVMRENKLWQRWTIKLTTYATFIYLYIAS